MSAYFQPSDVMYYFGEPREAQTHTGDTFFSPWPWCPYREYPHDTHSVNEGNNICNGVPGMLRSAPRERVEELVNYWQKLFDNALSSLESAAANAKRYFDELSKYKGMM